MPTSAAAPAAIKMLPAAELLYRTLKVLEITSSTADYGSKSLRPVTRRAIFMVTWLLEQQRKTLCSVKIDPGTKKYLSILLLGSCVVKTIEVLITKKCSHAKAAIEAIEEGSSDVVSKYVRALQKYAHEIGDTVAELPVKVSAALYPNPIDEAVAAVPSIVIDASLDRVPNQTLIDRFVTERVKSSSVVFGFSGLPR